MLFISDVKTGTKNKVPLVRSLTLNWVTFCIETSNKAVILKVHKDYVPICMEVSAMFLWMLILGYNTLSLTIFIYLCFISPAHHAASLPFPHWGQKKNGIKEKGEILRAFWVELWYVVVYMFRVLIIKIFIVSVLIQVNCCHVRKWTGRYNCISSVVQCSKIRPRLN